MFHTAKHTQSGYATYSFNDDQDTGIDSSAANQVEIMAGGTTVGTFTSSGGSITATDITGGDSSLGIAGQAAAQGGAVAITGGTSSTAGNAGGAVTATGGTPGATSAGGAVTLTGGAGGATSGSGGAATITGGAGTAGNATGGVATVTGGAGQGTGAGAVASVVGGASGAGATGNGGNSALTGGAAASTNGSGGSVVLTGGAKTGTGIAGGVFSRSNRFQTYAAPGTGADQAEVLTAAQLINGIYVHTISTGRTLTTPSGANITAGCPAEVATGDCFLFHLITVGTGADDIVTLTAGDGNVTFVGNVTVGPDSATNNGYGTFLFRKTGASTWVGYRIG